MAYTDKMKKLSCEFFQVFSQFEYCLKVTGYGFAEGNGNAKPDWKRFAEELPSPLKQHDDLGVKEAVEYILSNPPKKQVIVEEVLQWSDVRPQAKSDSDLILQYVRRVRNNLFHGGKFNGRFFDPERSEKLLSSSIQILYACILLSRSMTEAYENRMD